LKAVKLGDGLNVIRKATFGGCSALLELILPEGVKEIGEEAFSKCACLKMVKLGSELVTICARAFGGCSALLELVLPDGVKEIGQEALSGCRNLLIVKFGIGLKMIGKMAFSGCSALVQLAIPDRVRSIGKDAFSGCDSLKSLSLAPFWAGVANGRGWFQKTDAARSRFGWGLFPGEPVCSQRCSARFS
jgi:hypothetical protein